MKTTIKLFALLLTSSLLFSCQSEEVNPITPQSVEESITPGGGYENTPETRHKAGSPQTFENAIQ